MGSLLSAPTEFMKIRGLFRYLVLYILKDQPLHGYGIMKKVSELLKCDYIPSPGIIYPTLQLLEDMGLVESRIEGRRKVYRLTNEGRRVLENNIQEVEEFITKIRYLGDLARELGLETLVNTLRKLVMNITSIPPEAKERIKEHINEIVKILNSIVESK